MRGCAPISYGWGRAHIRVNNRAYVRFGLAQVAADPAQLRETLAARSLSAPSPTAPSPGCPRRPRWCWRRSGSPERRAAPSAG